MAAEAAAPPTAAPDSGVPGWLARWAARPRMVLGWLAVVAVVVHLPALGTGYILDDFLHASMLDGRFPGDRAGWDLYNFVDASNREVMQAMGLLPWWTHPDLQIRFFRPLSSWLIGVDRTLFGDATVPAHLHSLAWWAVVLALAARLYRLVLPARAATIALWIFMLAPCHAMPLSWLANRDVILSLAFGIAGLLAWVQFRTEGGAAKLGLAAIAFSLAFAAGEYGLTLAGYLVAFELTRRRDLPWQRLLSQATYFVPCAIYMTVRSRLGCGSDGSGFYTDPFRDPWLFLYTAPRRLAHLFLEGWLGLDDETITYSYETWMVIVLALALAAALWFVARHVTRHAPETRRAVVWLALGSLAAMMPVLAVVPATRLLGGALLGIAPVAAVIVDGAWFEAPPGPYRGLPELTAALALILGFAHLIHAPITTWLLCEHHRESSIAVQQQVETLEAAMSAAGTDDVLSLRGGGASHFMPFALERELPDSYAVFAQSSHVLVVRTGERSLEMIGPREGGIYPWGEWNLYRDGLSWMAVGERYRAAGAWVTVTEVDGGRVVSIRIDADRPLDTALWVNEMRDGFVNVTLPAEGFGEPYDVSPPDETPASH